MYRKKMLLGFVESEFGIYATYSYNGQINSNKLELSINEFMESKASSNGSIDSCSDSIDLPYNNVSNLGLKNVFDITSHNELLLELTENKCHIQEYEEFKKYSLENLKPLLLTKKSNSASYENLEEKIEEAMEQKRLIEELGLDPKKINIGISNISDFKFGKIAIEKEDGVGFAITVFNEIFNWISYCLQNKDYETIRTNSEYMYMITENNLLPCVFTQFELTNYVKEWKVKTYLKNMFENENCLKEFEKDFD